MHRPPTPTLYGHNRPAPKISAALSNTEIVPPHDAVAHLRPLLANSPQVTPPKTTKAPRNGTPVAPHFPRRKCEDVST